MYRNTLATITTVLTLTLNFILSQVVISEIHYNPATSQGSDNDYEFLELHNPGATDIDMSGYYFTQGVTHTFADGTTLPAIEKPRTVVPFVLISNPLSAAAPSEAPLTFKPDTLN